MEFINNPGAPTAIGPYTQAIQSGSLVFCSGQTPVDPQTMQIEARDIEGQTERALLNLGMVLKARQLDLHHVIKVNVYLADMNLFEGMNKAYGKYLDRIFQPAPPLPLKDFHSMPW